MSTAIMVTAPELFRLISVIVNDIGESWQLTEAKNLLVSSRYGGLLNKALMKYGGLVPSANFYLESELLSKKGLPPPDVFWRD